MSRREVDTDAHDVVRILWGDASVGPEGAVVVPRARRSRYALLPRTSRTTALLPTWPPSVTAAMVRNYVTPTSPAERTRAAVLGTIARLGFFAVWPCSISFRRAADGSGLVDHLAQILSHDVIAGVYLGPRRANRKPVLQLITAEGELLAYVKVGMNDFTSKRVSNETAALRELNRVPLRTMTVPEVLADGAWRGHRFLVLAPVPTRSDAEPVPDRRAGAMAELSRSFGVKTTRLAQADWWREIEDGLMTVTGADAALLRSLAARVAEFFGDCLLETGAAHGDWTPWNMAVVDGHVVVWDWERFRYNVPIGWDAIHYAAELHRHSGVRPGDVLTRMIAGVFTTTQGCGSTTNDAQLVFVTYLLDLGQRYLTDGQSTGVQPRGPISQWLLEPLTKLVRDLTMRSRL